MCCAPRSSVVVSRSAAATGSRTPRCARRYGGECPPPSRQRGNHGGSVCAESGSRLPGHPTPWPVIALSEGVHPRIPPWWDVPAGGHQYRSTHVPQPGPPCAGGTSRSHHRRAAHPSVSYAWVRPVVRRDGCGRGRGQAAVRVVPDPGRVPRRCVAARRAVGSMGWGDLREGTHRPPQAAAGTSAAHPAQPRRVVPPRAPGAAR
jgi:hypothetical protein